MADYPAQDRKLNLPATEVQGRKFTKYDPAIAMDIVSRIADGETLTQITKKDAVPQTVTRGTFLRWVASEPELAKAYAAAKQLSALSFEEEAIDEARALARAPGSPQNVSARNTLISQLRWSAARRNPTVYSDKGNTQVIVPVNISSTLNLGNGASADTVEVPDMYTIKLEGEREEKEDVQEGEFEPLPDDASREAIKAAIVASIPKEGTGVLRKEKPMPPHPTGPRKRVLIPAKDLPPGKRIFKPKEKK